MKKFRLGIKQIIVEVVTGFLTTLVLNALSQAGFLPDNVAMFINIFLIISNIILALSMLSWGLFYTIGWLIGSFLFFKAGMLQIWEFLLYFVLPAAVLAGRIALIMKKSIHARG
jgi:hypothetical protein